MAYINKDLPEMVRKRLEEEKQEARECRPDGSNGVCVKARKPGPSETLLDDKVIKGVPEPGIRLIEIAKEIREKEKVSLAIALDLACRRNPGLYEEYTNRSG